MEEYKCISIRNGNELAHHLSSSVISEEKRSNEWSGGAIDQK